MESSVVQKKDKTKAAGGRQISPDSQSEERRENGATAGVPLFLQSTLATPPADDSATTIAPEEVELKGVTNLDEALSENNKAWLGQQKRKRGKVKVKFGKLAKGEVEVKKSGKHYQISKGAIPLNHPVFKGVSDDASGLAPHLAVNTSNGTLSGFVAPGAVAKQSKELSDIVKKAPDIMGLVGFSLPRLPLVNKLENGDLLLSVKDAAFELGGVFSGQFSLEVVNEAVSFSGQATVVVTGLAQGDLSLARNKNGLITGSVTVAVSFPTNISGSVTLGWDGEDISGQGKVRYTGEKLSGDVLLSVMDKGKAAQLENSKKAPEGEVSAPAKKEKPKKKRELVVFGEGNLVFAFTEWLNGTAQVIIDPKGYLTVIGKITPQKEFELFPQKDYNKDLFKVEARAKYGIPVVGNIFIFANIGMTAFAKLGPAKLYKIEVAGTYSTDPDKSKNFSIQGVLNISAAAGLQLRGEGGAGLEVLAHDIKAGAGINAIAGIRGYTEATPVIGYREKPGALGEDKKGEFFLRGEFEIAAQPFLGLSGDLFVEVDAPLWSPVPDKRWTWPLGGKEWPMGGEFGIGANVDYVFGSGQWPSLEFKPVNFDADKFMTDLYNDKAVSKSDKGEKQGKWKEKNSKAAAPPAMDGKGGDALPGKSPGFPNAKPKVAPGTAKPSSKQVNPHTKTADGKTVKEYQDEANKKQSQSDKNKSEQSFMDKSGKDKETSKDIVVNKWEKGVKVVRQTLNYAEKTGIEEKELNRILKSILKRKEFGFSRLYAKEDPKQKKQWVVYGGMSPIKPVMSIKKSGQASVTQKALEQEVGYKAPTYPIDGMYRATGASGYIKKMKRGGDREVLPATTSLLNKGVGYMAGDHRGHLIGDRFNGPSIDGNLVPMHSNLNLSTFKQFENAAASEFLTLKPDGKTGDPALLFMKVTPKYPGNDRLDPASYRPVSVVAEGEVTTLEKQDNEVKRVSKKISRMSFPNPEGDVRRVPPVNLSTASLKEMEMLPGIGPVLAKNIMDTRDKLVRAGGKFYFYEDLKQVPGMDENRIRQMRSDPSRPVRIR